MFVYAFFARVCARERARSRVRVYIADARSFEHDRKAVGARSRRRARTKLHSCILFSLPRLESQGQQVWTAGHAAHSIAIRCAASAPLSASFAKGGVRIAQPLPVYTTRRKAARA